MGFFLCCKYCDHRSPGCHSTCPEYLEDKRKLAEAKEAERKLNDIPPAKTDYRNNPVWTPPYKR